MFTTSKILDLHAAISRELPFPIELEDILNVAINALPEQAFIDDGFFDQCVEVNIGDDNELTVEALASVLHISPELALYEILHMFKNALSGGLIKVDPTNQTFVMIGDFIDDEPVYVTI